MRAKPAELPRLYTKRLHKLVWTEGMYLAPHHFQSQARFYEASISFFEDCFWQHGFGFTGLEIDENELRGGSFVTHHLRGVMPDGMPFDLKANDELPAPVPIADVFPQTGHPLMLFLSVRPCPEGQASVSAENTVESSRTRYRISRLQLADFNTGQDPKPVKLLRPDFRVEVAAECRDDDVAMPLARIVRDGKGNYVLDPTYVAPCLRVASSARLTFLLKRLVGVLSEKSRDLTARRRGAGAAETRGDRGELVEFWLLHSVNSAIPVLRIWTDGRSPHPAHLFVELSRLAGALCTFASGSTPMSLPDYDHEALGDCFDAVDLHIQQHLEISLPTRCLTVALTPFSADLGSNSGSGGASSAKESLFLMADIRDHRCFDSARWILSVRAPIARETLISQVPDHVRVSSKELIGRLAAFALPGVPLNYLPVPPASVPLRDGDVFFGLDRMAGAAGRTYFEAIRDYRTVGISVPSHLNQAEMKLYIVLDNPA